MSSELIEEVRNVGRNRKCIPLMDKKCIYTPMKSERGLLNFQYAQSGQYGKLTGWRLDQISETAEGKAVEYSECPIYRSGVSRARLVGDEGVEKVVYVDNPERIELFDRGIVRALNKKLGVKSRRVLKTAWMNLP